MAAHDVTFEYTDRGLRWGPMEFIRLGQSSDGRVWFRIDTAEGPALLVRVSPTGRSIRVFKRGKGELKAASDGR